MAKVLSLSSQVVWGPVGNTAAVPAMQERGHEVLQVPTILLSHHPGHGAPALQRTGAEVFAALLASVEGKGGLADCAAVFTGYFASAEQVVITAEMISRLRANNPALMVLVDPVMGDDGRLYVADGIAAAIRDRLVPLASVITPNCFELGWLTGRPVHDVDSAAAAARMLSVAEVVVTSVPVDASHLATLLLSASGPHAKTSVRKPHVPHGTGDYLAGAYLAARLLMPADKALDQAMLRLETVIARSGNGVLQNT
jgi:pyridoxine kinase